MTNEELMQSLQTAITAGDFKEVARISKEIAKTQAETEKAAKSAAMEAVVEITKKVKAKIDGAIQKMIDSGDLSNEAVEGVWYSNDFGTTDTACRLIKTAKRTTSGGGGGGKKFSVTTKELLEAHGDEPYNDEMSCQQFYDANEDGNKRYQVRMKLLKVAGYIS